MFDILVVRRDKTAYTLRTKLIVGLLDITLYPAVV